MSARGIPIEPEPVRSHELRQVAIPCGFGAKSALITLARELNAEYVEAREFACKECFTRWSAGDFSGAHEVERISCSNCYSDRVLITSVRVEFVEFRR